MIRITSIWADFPLLINRSNQQAFYRVSENVVLQDEGETHERKLDLAGAPVTVIRYNGLIHDYGLLNPLATVPSIRSALIQGGTEIKSHLV